MRRLAFALGLLCLATCGPPVTSKPLSSPEKAVPDKALLGKWRGEIASERDEDAKHLPLEVTVKAGGVMSFRVKSDRPGERDTVFEGHVTEVGKLHVLNLVDRSDPKAPTDEFIPVRYELSKDGALTFWILSEDAIAKAIQSGALKGTVTGSPASSKITDEPSKVVAFLKKAKVDEVFARFAVFHREG